MGPHLPGPHSCCLQYFQAHKNAKANKVLGTGSSLNLSTIY